MNKNYSMWLNSTEVRVQGFAHVSYTIKLFGCFFNIDFHGLSWHIGAQYITWTSSVVVILWHISSYIHFHSYYEVLHWWSGTAIFKQKVSCPVKLGSEKNVWSKYQFLRKTFKHRIERRKYFLYIQYKCWQLRYGEAMKTNLTVFALRFKK